MQSCSSAFCVLILLTITVTVADDSPFPPVKMNRHDSATLPCSERCSGLVRWSVSHKPTDVLAECDQTECRSKEGYQMIHDQYLKGNLSLTITDADFSKRGWYTCECDGKDLRDVRLQIEPLKTPIQVKPSESLVLDLHITDPVKVIYNTTDSAGPSSGQICTVDGHSTQCKPEYKHRVSLTAALTLRGMTPSDSGVYTVMDTRNEEVIHIYTVTIQDHSSDLDRDRGPAAPVWVIIVLAVMGTGFLTVTVVLVVLVMVNVRLKGENHQLRMKDTKNRVETNERSDSTEEEKLNVNPEVERSLPPKHRMCTWQ
ncbi:uncharacterized protein LOC118801928 [Colossoma macropomum]|uniref:uncharacterized protein LOC118801928 n=1 Tax=Colossoma macropomum TaxID=42526 RepID=UPI001864F668|nr:uncharacterized protein LOC118801928 [Colossoma macropomum]